MMALAKKQTHDRFPFMSFPLIENRNPLVSRLITMDSVPGICSLKVCLAG
jgi:hypothetical protein